MKIVILIIALILLIAFLWKRSRPILKGGEYFKLDLASDEITPSLSMLVLHPDDRNVYYDQEDIENEKLLDGCVQRLKDQTSAKWNDTIGIFTEMNGPKRVSDAFIDMILVNRLKKDIKSCYGACEWNPFKFKSKGSNLISMMLNDSETKEWAHYKSVDHVWFMKEFLHYLSYSDNKMFSSSRTNEIKDLSEIQDVIKYLKTWQSESSKSLGNKITKKSSVEIKKSQWLYDEFKQYKTSLKSQRIRNIFNGYFHTMETKSLECLSEFIDETIGTLEEIKTVKPKQRVDIYIEYSYNLEHAYEIYKAVHSHSSEVINHIMHLPVEDGTHHVYCYRFALQIDYTNKNLYYFRSDRYKDYLRKKTWKTPYKTIISLYDDSDCTIVQVPESNNDLFYDEQLFMETKNTIYFIQLEHSENGSDHKSNFIEFLGRVLSPTLTLYQMQATLKQTKYKMNNDKLVWKPVNDAKIQFPNALLFQSFGKHMRSLFEDKPYSGSS